GQDDVDALGFEAADPPALSPGETFKSLADGRDVGLMQQEPVAARSVAMGAEVDTGEGADGSTEADHDLTAGGGGQADHQLRADLAAEGSQLARCGRIVVNEAACGPDGAERQACHRDDLPAPYPAELEAGAAEVGDEAVVER